MSVQRIPFPGESAGALDRERIRAQLGRPPRGDVAVAVRCMHRLPAVIRTAPILDDGTPFPTLYYLTCPLAARAVGALEAGGRMEELNARLGSDEELQAAYTAAHERYGAQRDAIGVLDDEATAGGMPGRVKCLHALVAHELADGNPVGALVRDEVEPRACPAPCITVSDDGGARVQGHPAFRKARR